MVFRQLFYQGTDENLDSTMLVKWVFQTKCEPHRVKVA